MGKEPWGKKFFPRTFHSDVWSHVMIDETVKNQVDALLQGWSEDPLQTKDVFVEYMQLLDAQPGVRLDFKARPGVSYSLRAAHEKQEKRSLFVMVDVVDDEPEARWLSVCFYADMIQDPDELGDFVPGGLLGEDACCFNLDENDANMRAYIRARILEAAHSAAQ